MAHRCYFTDEIHWDEESKQFYLAIYATGIEKCKDQYFEIIRIYPNGEQFARALSFSYLGGYTVTFPGEKYYYDSYYHYDYEVITEDYPFEKIHYQCNITIAKSILNKELILKHDPDLKYLVDKYKGKKNMPLFRLMTVYKEHPEIESLVMLNQWSLATDKRLWNLSKKKKLEVIDFVKKNYEKSQDMKLSKILSCIKHKVKFYEDYDILKNCAFDYKILNYIKKQNSNFVFYNDYLIMAQNAGHNIDDDYWKYPKNLQNAHDEVRQELIIIDEAKTLKKRKKQNEAILIINEANPKCTKMIDGYKIRLPLNEKDIIDQANTLNQCLIRCNYDERFASLNTILLFILKGDERIATAEIGWDKQIIQFYCNELDRKNCKPSEELRNILNQYLKGLRIKKPKFTQVLSLT